MSRTLKDCGLNRLIAVTPSPQPSPTRGEGDQGGGFIVGSLIINQSFKEIPDRRASHPLLGEDEVHSNLYGGLPCERGAVQRNRIQNGFCL